MMKRRSLLILLISLTLSGAWAQNSGKVWTLEECIQYAWKNNIQVRQSELNVMTSQLNLKQAQANRLPNLNATVSGRNNVGRSIDPFTNVIVDQDVTSQSYNINSSVTLFNGLGQINTINQNKADLAKSEYDLENQKNTTALSIANFYLNILLAQEQVKSAELSLQTSELQLDRTDKQVKAGALALQSLLQARQQVANDEVNLITVQNTLDLARLNLKQALQLPASTEMEISFPQIGDPSDEELGALDLDIVYQQAQSLPMVKSAESQLESSTYRVQVARAGRYPSLTLSGGLNTAYSSAAPNQFPDPNSPSGFKENTYMNQLDFNLARFVGLNLSIPIFSRLQNNTNVGLAKVTQNNSKYILEGTKNQLRQDIEQAYYNARAAAKTYQATKKQVEALEESFRNVEQRFNLGSSNTVEYNQIRNDYNRAQNDLIRSKYDFIFKLKVLEFYQGKPLQL
jgi:outer membrane protein